MSVVSGPNLVTNGLIFDMDMSNTKKSYFGGPVTNSQWNGGSEVTPWTVSGTNTDVSGTMNVPVPTAKTWKFNKSGSSNQWNGWEGSYGSIWTGSSGDIWTTSYWYKTTNPAGNTGFGVGAFYTSDWARAYSTTILDNVSTIIADGEWHYNYTVVKFNEAYSSAIIADGPSWGYSTLSGELYINGLQWNKNSYASQFTQGTRSNTQVIQDLTGKLSTITANLSYAYNGQTFSFDGSGSTYINVSRSDLNGGSWAYSNVTACAWLWIDPTSAAGENNVATVENAWEYKWINNNNGTAQAWYASNPWAWYGPGTVPTGQWFMYTFRHGASNGDLWANDSQVFTQAISGGIGAGSGYPMLTLMGRTGGPGSPAKGKLGAFHLYNRALTDAEIAQNFNATRSRYGV
jgi:hypothetical protein